MILGAVDGGVTRDLPGGAWLLLASGFVYALLIRALSFELV